MDQSWRFRPVQGNMTNICPTCSISHFPFCPQPPAFNRNAFPLENDYAFHRPFFDNRGPPEVPRSLLRSDYRFNPMISVPRNTNDVYGDSQNWYRDQNLRIDSFRQFPQPSEMVDSASGNGFRGDGFQPPVINPGSDLFLKGEPDEMGRFSKRMKIEERSFTHMPPSVRGDYCLNLSNTSRMSSEDERRLSLVRDHGGQPSTLQSQRVTDSLGGTSLAIGHKQNGFYNGISLQQRNLKYADAAGKANFGDSEIIRTDMPLKLQDNIRAEHLHRELGGYGQQHVQSKRSGFGSDSGHTFFQNREGGMGAFLDSQYEERLRPHGQTENLLHPSMQTIGHTYIPRSGPNFLKSDQRNQDSEVLHGREEYWHKMDGGDGPLAASQSGNLNQYSHMSRDVPLHISEGSNEMYHAANLQKYQPKDTVPANDLIYPGMTNWQGSSQSNALHHEQRSSWTEHCAPNSQLPQPYTRQQPFQNSHDHFHAQKNDTRQSFEQKPESVNEIQGSVGPCKNQRDYITVPAVTSMGSTNLDQVQISRAFGAQPPLPPLTLPHIVDPTGQPASDLQVTSSLPVVSSLLFPIPATSWTTVPLSHSHTPEGQPSSQAYFHNKPSNGFTLEGSQIVLETSSTKYLKGQNFPAGNISSDKPKIIDASHIFKKPYRDNRPDHIVIILRGLPGSGKSYLAKMLRDLEVENGGAAPRIHSMDDYFMTEVEKVEESEGSSSLVKGKKAITKRVMEYCYEPEMEEAYRSSMLKAFKKNLEEGIFTCIIVDDRNLRVADFAQFWAIAKRSGYEAYLLEATYKDPVGCAARNVHGFNQDDIQKMALQWEEAPPLYLKLDIQSLFHGDELNEHGIQEVDMDMEDEACDEGLSELPDRKCDRVVEPAGGDHESVGSLKNIEGWNAEGDDPEVKELGRSKWSDDLDEAVRTPENSKGNSNALSGLIQAYGRGGKSVHWGDKAGKTGFSIGAVKAANMSLVIGPGAGYNLKSNPLPEEEDAGAVEMGGESKKRSMFQEQLRAERESFRAIFDRRRRQRIGGLEVEDE